MGQNVVDSHGGHQQHSHGGHTASKSYCQAHGKEIVFACYQCQKTCCHDCEAEHYQHHIVFFKDEFISQASNFENLHYVPHMQIKKQARVCYERIIN